MLLLCGTFSVMDKTLLKRREKFAREFSLFKLGKTKERLDTLDRNGF